MNLATDAIAESAAESVPRVDAVVRLRSLLVGPIGVALVVFATLALLPNPWPVGIFYDDGTYLILGKSLATGQGYRYLNLPGAPEATHFPPGYPALLAMLWRIWPDFPANVALFKTVNAMLYAAGTAGATHLAVRRLGMRPTVAAAVCAVAAFAPAALMLAGVLLAGPLFFTLFVIGLLLAERVTAIGSRAGMRALIALGVVTAALVHVRSLGAALFVGVTGALLLRRRPVAAAIPLCVGLGLLIPWELWAARRADSVPMVLVSSYGSYGDFIHPAPDGDGTGFFARTAMKNARRMVSLAGELTVGVPVMPLRALLGAIVVALTAVGLVRLRRTPATLLAVLAYIGAVMIWPFQPDRFLMDVFPLLALLPAAGALAAWEWRPGPGMSTQIRRAALAAAGVVGLGFVATTARALVAGDPSWLPRSAAGRVQPQLDWIARNAEPDAVIATSHDPLVHLYTGRPTVPNHGWSARDYLAPQQVPEAAAHLRAILAAYDVRYVLVQGRQVIDGAAVLHLLAGDAPPLQLADTLAGGGAVFIPLAPSAVR